MLLYQKKNISYFSFCKENFYYSEGYSEKLGSEGH